MATGISLNEHLDAWAGQDARRVAVADAVRALAEAGIELADVCAAGALDAGQGTIVGNNSGGDAQKALDVRSHEIVVAALKRFGVGMVASEEADDVEELTPGGLVAVATDPLDGSSNIDTNVSVARSSRSCRSTGRPIRSSCRARTSWPPASSCSGRTPTSC
ncbi:Fructose-1,6-bisphosphatase class 1 [Methylobrevis pamukkalensis]|uniref:Fructose-1,6-bisphosphatase class 1 n=1 Tax=Methylobrevis pamukkalensis TaxID=1439726 RepID=A0A1E3H0S7_9HYPH|nr:Fructose-1,6-bisphosphatase class 1 [Methylobrevis pamukkalensis]